MKLYKAYALFKGRLKRFGRERSVFPGNALLRKSFTFKVIVVFAGLSFLFQVFYPTVAFALTGGPSQPEMQGFTPIGMTNMVDLSSGSFTYNIPLMDVEGYPINLSYHSGITMDQEASWVGLGWNINPGEINRQMRGLPDDFSGDQVTQQYNMKDNLTVGFDLGVALKIFGLPNSLGLNLNAKVGVFTNNYKGPGIEYGLSPSLNSGQANKGCLTGSLGLNFNSQSGFDISPSIGFSHEVYSGKQSNTDAGITVGTSYNSRTGLKGLTMSRDIGASGKELTSNPDNGDMFNQSDMSRSSSISFSAPSYTPTINMPLMNNAVTYEATLGLDFIGAHPNFTFTGYYNDQALATHKLSLPAYGYMYADQSKNNPYALHDFNREKDVPYTPHIANLPITNFTYDLFSINGQGVSGQFRPFRGDVGILYDHENYNTSTSSTLGVELGLGDVVHGGVQLNFNNSNTVTDQWSGNNDFASTVHFQGIEPGNLNYEPFYVKNVGEMSVNDASYYTKIGGSDPMCVHLDRSGSTVTAGSRFSVSNGTLLGVGDNLIKTRREKRDQCTSMLSASEAHYFGLDTAINSYPYNTNVYDSCNSADKVAHISRLSWPVHHISQITVTNPDGKRYVYGIPAYNTLQKEATFSVDPPSTFAETNYAWDSINLVNYDSNSDNSISNGKGLDNYFNEESIPSYSHSVLLTGILSPDYVDLTGNGITDDDLGQAIKINWTRVYSRSKPYRWRTPFEAGKASYQVGLMSKSNDDKGNYIYGEKEIWYVHSIESKTMVAQFILEDRYDAFGVKDENGGIDSTKHLKCLKEIKLYSKADLIKNGGNAVPIKTVHFVYDYSLCPGSPNSNASGNGKLTLKKVYFTYGNNTEGSLNSYQFTYSSFNPSYSHNRYDRWGYFKDNPSSMPPNEDFPYTLQDSTKTNLYSTAWELTGIDLPSGGHITVKYESNQYAYVQNWRATQMFIVNGVGDGSAADSTHKELYNGSNSFYDYVYVRLPVPVDSKKDFYDKYLAGVDSAGISKLYFRFLVNVGSLSDAHYEYVPGYADIANYHMINSSLWAIKLSEVNCGKKSVGNDGNVSPMALASWQFVRLNLPEVAYPNSYSHANILSAIVGLLSIVSKVLQVFTGFDKEAEIQNFGRYFVPAYSYVRLDNPSYDKYGGGTRVKEIDISDNWADMVSGQSSFTYGQTFDYNTTLPDGQVISSGVATYEPTTGGDENPCRQPLSYEEKYLLAPNNQMYTETPLGESLYPAPGVVYSKVTVANLNHSVVSRTGTGYTVTQFYTAKDFPVVNYWTDIGAETKRIKPNFLLSLFSIGSHDYTNVSQGFTVEVNDMAGKEKSQEVYDQNGALISSVEYDYKVDNPNSPKLRLNNDVEVVNSDGSISTASVGKDIDVWQDMREQDTKTFSFGTSVNSETFVWPFPPIPLDIPTFFPTFSKEHTRFRSAVTTKYIYRHGLVDKVKNMQNGSAVTTTNLLYDAETGKVLLTQTNNGFDKPEYQFTYPAHWAYDGMGSEYRNIGGVMDGVSTHSDGSISSPSLAVAKAFFAAGDELEYYTGTNLNPTKVWVTIPQPAAGDSLILMDADGNPVVLSNAKVKIIRSGRRNMADVPVGTIVSLNSPISNDSIKINDSLHILQAGGSMFSDLWPIPANKVMRQVCHSESVPADSLLAHFFDSIEAHHQLFASPDDSITFGKYVSGSAYSGDLFYALTQPNGYDQAYTYQAQLGDCMLNISSYSGGPTDSPFLLSLDSLTTWSSYGVQGTDTTNGCINLYQLTAIADSDTVYVSDPMYLLDVNDTVEFCTTHGGVVGTGITKALVSGGAIFKNVTGYIPLGGIVKVMITGTPLYRAITYVGPPEDFPLRGELCNSCEDCYDSCENLAIGQPFNPYAVGMMGNWRPERNYVYYDTRSPGLTASTTNIWNTGTFNHFTSLWTSPSGSATLWNPDTLDKNWTWTSKITMYDQKGNEIEDEDALDRYSSALYGYVKSMPVAVASNARFRDIAFDGFEDYGFTNTCSSPCDNSHFSFMGDLVPGYTDTTEAEAHTGKYSFMIVAHDSAITTRSINYYNNELDSTTSGRFYLLNGGNIPLFSPESGNYLLSAWVKENASCGITGYTKDSIVVSYSGASSVYVMKPAGPVIEGWQRFESRFTVPSSATAIKVKLVAGSNTAYYDDIRMEPFSAEMKSYVYDPFSLRLMATLDENNYATLYEYNDEGILLRVKKETERGIMTIKESRSSYPRN